jgi:hypothetical protein
VTRRKKGRKPYGRLGAHAIRAHKGRAEYEGDKKIGYPYPFHDSSF